MKTLLALCFVVLTLPSLAIRPEASSQDVETALEQGNLWDLLKTQRLPLTVDGATNDKLVNFFGIRIHQSTQLIPESERIADLAEALATYSKIPGPVLRRLHDRHKEMTLVGVSLKNHPNLQSLMKEGPARWKSDKTWADVPGLGRWLDSGAFIVLDSLHHGHGSVDLILHEMGHTIDELIGGWPSTDYSQSQDFSRVHARTPFAKVFEGQDIEYHRGDARENFAEMFAKYFHSEETRAKLAQDFPGAIEYYSHFFPLDRYVPSSACIPPPGPGGRPF